ncbi:hypothetical protein [Haloplanus rubicundus]|uniref:hypothetical protein n=1 Tax=Haloplanus rubicundus TaxID=1547898 RepID=UPI0016572945|nr:hypothetical protein [Haloplanus rubicundus]
MMLAAGSIGILVFSLPHLHREVPPAELFEGEFPEVAAAFGGDVVSVLLHGLVVGSFAVDIVGV